MSCNPVSVCLHSATFSSDNDGKVFLCGQDAETVRQRDWKVKAEAKVEQTRTCSTLNLNLDLSLLHSLRPCLGKGVSLGGEAVLADSRRAGEIVARVGRVRSLVFLSILLNVKCPNVMRLK